MTHAPQSVPSVCPAEPPELLAFLQHNAEQQPDPELQAELGARRDLPESAREWGFLIEQDGRPVGSLGLRASPPEGLAVAPFGLVLPWHADPVPVGVALFRHALTQVQAQGAAQFKHLIPARASHGEALRAIFEELGLPAVRETVQYTWPGGAPPEPAGRLGFRALTEVSETAFQGAIERSLQATLDQVDQREVQRAGAPARALDLYRILRGIEAPDAWWTLAYNSHDDLVGLIVVNRLGADLGTVGYLAVMPEHRGAGYGYDLLVHGTRTLLEAGLPRILLDTDVTNLPTQQLNERAGYERQGVASRYAAALPSGLT